MNPTSAKVLKFYATNNEAGRLSGPNGLLEFERTKSVIERYCQTKSVIIDVGGGTGPYSLWLAANGHDAHLVEPAANLLDEAKRQSALQTHQIKTFHFADARSLPFPSNFADLVLMFGPLYHLQQREDRLKALNEAFRCLKSGGKLLAVGISRFASLMDGFRKSYFDDPEFFGVVTKCLTSGHHSNPTGNSAYFTDAYFHKPEELEKELSDAGFSLVETVGVEGPAWLFPSLVTYMSRQEAKVQILELLSQVQHEPSIIGASAHVLAVGVKRPNQPPESVPPTRTALA